MAVCELVAGDEGSLCTGGFHIAEEQKASHLKVRKKEKKNNVIISGLSASAL